jgi:hypothetical protein
MISTDDARLDPLVFRVPRLDDVFMFEHEHNACRTAR